MKPNSSFPIYREINECHEATGFPVRTDLPDFHVFTLEETYPSTRLAMPPYRRGFYQVTYLEEMGDATVWMESSAVTSTKNLIIFSPPEQVLSWVCGQTERGFMFYFKPELFADPGQSVEGKFPFFEPFAMNVLPFRPADGALIRPQLERLRTIFHSAHPYRRAKLSALTTALLYDLRALYEQRNKNGEEQMATSGLVVRFRQLVARCFQQHCSLDAYAQCLHVSVDHLSAMVKKHTGRTARDIIDDRVLLEAKRLLTHTDLTVGEIAYHLQFSEPTHFARFFKRHTQHTPLTFRRGASRLQALAVT